MVVLEDIKDLIMTK